MDTPKQEDDSRHQDVPNAEFVWRKLGLPGRPQQCKETPLASETDLIELTQVLEQQRERIGRLAETKETTETVDFYRELGLNVSPAKLKESNQGPEVDYAAVHAYVRGDATPEQMETVLQNREFRSWWKAEGLIFQFEIQLARLRNETP